MIKSQKTLYAKPHDAADAGRAIEIFKNMNNAQRKRHLDFLKSMTDVNKEEEGIDFPTVAEFLAENQLEAELEAAGFSTQTQAALKDLFFKTIEERLRHDPFRKQLQELLNDYSPPSPFITDAGIDACELLGNRIQELQDQIAFAENERDQLADEIRELLHDPCNEEEKRMPKRSTINEMMLEPTDEENAFNEQPVGDRRMQQYLRAFGRDQ